MIINNSKIEIPITKNVVFAMRLDTEIEQEHIIIGELPEVLRYLRGGDGKILTQSKRPFGSFILDCSQPIANDLADVRAILSSNTGKKKSPYFEKSREILNNLWQSENLVSRYVALRIWQEYNKACKIKDYDLYSAIETISLPLMVHLKADILEWQEQEPQNPMGFLSNDYFLHPASVLYAKGKTLTEYQAADLSLLPLVVYYLKTVYNQKTYIQTCKRCGKLFRANTANIPTFCSDECKKEQNRENKRRFDEKAKDTPYEAAYKTNYMYWYNRIAKLRKNATGTERLTDAKVAFDAFCKEAVKKKKAIINGKADERDFESWMLQQRDIIDRLMEQQ
ncbi:MAG: hypothetical protein LBU66_00485 [Treponema sp.]|jgi:hypothetical protein|nr:hypothetical protein [Treponema sp.]